MVEAQQIINKLQNKHSFFITGHVNPDGDAIGACLALAMILSRLGKRAVVYLEEYAEKYRCIPGQEFVTNTIPKGFRPDVFIALDCAGRDRLGSTIPMFERSFSINIDHHVSNTLFGDMNYVDPNASSTSEIIYTLFGKLTTVDKNIAGALYAGIVYDTGGFKHTSTTAYTLCAAGELLSCDINFNYIYEKMLSETTFPGMKLMGRALDTAEIFGDGYGIYSVITAEDLKELGGTHMDIDSVVNVLKSVRDTQIAVFFYEKEDGEVKVSFRSTDTVDVRRIAGFFGGGGHIKAAGCSVNLPIGEAVEKVMARVTKYL